MTRPCGYGRYADDAEHVGCPRAATDMTPCVARDGSTAVADDETCVGCGAHPAALLVAQRDELELTGELSSPADTADELTLLVREATDDSTLP